MPDFDARITSGVAVQIWTDDRANPLQSHPHRCFRGTVGVPVVISAVVGGVVGPADTALGGRLFSADLLECPAPTPTSFTAGLSSVQQFTPRVAGHYMIALRRTSGGAMRFPVEV
jgi:hypothetical protein